FGMLIWELCYEKIAYINMNLKEIVDHVSSNKREELPLGIFNGPSDKIIQKEFIGVIEKVFEKLALTYPIADNTFQLLENGTIDFDGEIAKSKNLRLPKFSEEFVLSETIKAAWKCFDENASFGNSLAKYWKGYYLYEGHFVNKDIYQATKFFKEAADDNITDAQFRYAFSLLSAAVLGDLYLKGKLGVEQNKELGLSYLRLAALEGSNKA
ncbi:13103_t:CDS:2, partial [Dentiscutata heterogama]